MQSPTELRATVFVGNIAVFCTEGDLAKHFSSCGEIIEIRLALNEDKSKHLSYGFVRYTNIACAQLAIQTLNGTLLCGRPLKVDRAQSQRLSPQGNASASNKFMDRSSSSFNSASVHVSFLSHQTRKIINEETLRFLFGGFGAITDVIITKHNIDEAAQKQSGYGFVHFPLNAEGIESALKMSESVIDVLIDGVNYKCKLSHDLELRFRQQQANAPRQSPGGANVMLSSPHSMPASPLTATMSYHQSSALSPLQHQQQQLSGSASYYENSPAATYSSGRLSTFSTPSPGLMMPNSRLSGSSNSSFGTNTPSPAVMRDGPPSGPCIQSPVNLNPPVSYAGMRPVTNGNNNPGRGMGSAVNRTLRSNSSSTTFYSLLPPSGAPPPVSGGGVGSPRCEIPRNKQSFHDIADNFKRMSLDTMSINSSEPSPRSYLHSSASSGSSDSLSSNASVGIAWDNNRHNDALLRGQQNLRSSSFGGCAPPRAISLDDPCAVGGVVATTNVMLSPTAPQTPPTPPPLHIPVSSLYILPPEECNPRHGHSQQQQQQLQHAYHHHHQHNQNPYYSLASSSYHTNKNL
eukprot:gene9353-10324_t